MKIYADRTNRRTWQVVADVAVVCWVALCVWLGRAVHDGIGQLHGPVDNLASAGTSIQTNMAGAADSVSGVPLVGDSLRTPFDAIAGAGQTIANVGTSLGMTVDQVARAAGIVTAVVPIVVVVTVWAVLRIRFVRRATDAQAWLSRPGALELFAVRALTRQPLRRLDAVGPDPAGRFREGHRSTLLALADLELTRCGLAPRRDEEWPAALPA